MFCDGLSYRNSKNIDIALGRQLITKLGSQGIALCNKDKDEILQTMQVLYNEGVKSGIVKAATTLLEIAEKYEEQLPDAVKEYLESYREGNFEDSNAFERTNGRISKDEYYLGIANAVLQRSTCLRRRYGAIIVKNDEIIATGYNGSPRGEINCIDRGYCDRESLNIPKGERYEVCLAVHAEQNALLSAARKDTLGATMYIVGREVKTWDFADPNPCLICRRMIKNAGITRVVGFYKDEVIECKI